ncbi:MAG: FadR family transcriptional regulator [Acidobacteria bacterium]|nr:FadR family transcriptional regulator [Acidobacteriota bacterium]
MSEPALRLPERPRLHHQVTRHLALRVIQAERRSSPAAFPNETVLCGELGVSRTVLRESMKVLADKGMVQMRPRAGTCARPRSDWHLLDPDILAWQAELEPDGRFLRDLCEVLLAIEPTAAGFAALRATGEEIARIALCLEKCEGAPADEIVGLDLEFHSAVVEASHNPLLTKLSATIRGPFRTALGYTSRFPANVALRIEAHRVLLDALRHRDPLASRAAAEQVVGLAMLAVEEVIRASGPSQSKGKT